VDVGQHGAAEFLFDPAEDFQSLRPRNAFPLVRFALSNEALKMNRIPNAAVIPARSFAIDEASASDSSTHGPAMRNKSGRREGSGVGFFTGKQTI
jgi:hypothetical protein